MKTIRLVLLLLLFAIPADAKPYVVYPPSFDGHQFAMRSCDWRDCFLGVHVKLKDGYRGECLPGIRLENLTGGWSFDFEACYRGATFPGPTFDDWFNYSGWGWSAYEGDLDRMWLTLNGEPIGEPQYGVWRDMTTPCPECPVPPPREYHRFPVESPEPREDPIEPTTWGQIKANYR